LGRQVIDYAGEEGVTVGAVLEQVGIAAHGMDLRVNGDHVDDNTVLRNADVVTVIPRIKGGSRPTT
jgi:sulfur carrier protein ThiS